MASAPERLFFEDLQVGESFMSGSYEMTQERILSFASEFDPQPFHTDPDAAQETFLLGWLLAAGIPAQSGVRPRTVHIIQCSWACE